MSNIGGGSKATGGGGVDEGMKAMLQYTQANTVKKMVSQQKSSQNYPYRLRISDRGEAGIYRFFDC